MEIQLLCVILTEKKMKASLIFVHSLLNGLFFPVFILIFTLAMTLLIRGILKVVKKEGHWRTLHELGPCISDIILIVGLRLAAETAPITGRVEVWLDGIIYVLVVI